MAKINVQKMLLSLMKMLRHKFLSMIKIFFID